MRNNQHDPGCAEVQLEVREGKKEGGTTRVAVLHRPPANITPTSIFSKKQVFLTSACESGWCLKDAVMNEWQKTGQTLSPEKIISIGKRMFSNIVKNSKTHQIQLNDALSQ